ncbi:MAG: hypothetical protein EOM50_16645 [Erysipelotrichia bacterium]|nr:hypothetical protein [Erysipelotrichia bacterium]
MKTDEVYAQLLGCSVSGYYKWKKQQRPIFSFLEHCFTKEELETYLVTGNIPGKIEFANRAYMGMDSKLAYFITNTVKNKVHLILLFTYETLDDAAENAIELFEKKLISRKELADFMQHHTQNLSFEFSLYIKENLNQNWKVFERDIIREGINDWLPLYLEIIQLSIKHSCFEKVFGNYDNSEEQLYIPNSPQMFTFYQGWDDIDARYTAILSNVKKAILSNTLDSLPLWSIYDSIFTSQTVPIQ